MLFLPYLYFYYVWFVLFYFLSRAFFASWWWWEIPMTAIPCTRDPRIDVEPPGARSTVLFYAEKIPGRWYLRVKFKAYWCFARIPVASNFSSTWHWSVCSYAANHFLLFDRYKCQSNPDMLITVDLLLLPERVSPSARVFLESRQLPSGNSSL
jgi:hypothetical protein